MKKLFKKNYIAIFIFGVLGLSISLGFLFPSETNTNESCIEGECGFKIGCISEVTVEISREQGVRVLQQQCLQEGWTRDTPYYKELKKEGYARAEMKFD